MSRVRKRISRAAVPWVKMPFGARGEWFDFFEWEATATKVTTCYNEGMGKSIFGQQTTTLGANPLS